ncbi:MAG: SH3 domain-containing protein [Oscillibacter sp.]|nr:SH3 domain-containing protein [Oscillibacter sp.]
MLDLYYRFWAALLKHPPLYRAALVLLPWILIFWLFAKCKVWQALSFLLNLCVSGLCLLLEFAFSFLRFRAPLRYVRICDAVLYGALGRCHAGLEWLGKASARMRVWHFLLLWALSIALVMLPDMERVPSPNPVQAFYQERESYAGKRYVPLPLPSFLRVYGPEDNIWLSLTYDHRDGANIRRGPGTEYEPFTTIVNDDMVLWMGEKKRGWLRVRLTDGREGWIRETLVIGLP